MLLHGAVSHQEGKQAPIQAKNGARGTGTDHEGIPSYACHTPQQASKEIEHEKTRAAQPALHETPDVPERYHVEQQMQHADVQEHAGKHAPPFALRGPWPVVGPPLDEAINRRLHGINAPCHHETKMPTFRGERPYVTETLSI